MAIAPERLQPGDVLLYRPRGFFGWVIALKTWSRYAHIEVYDGEGYSVASRDGVGVDRYPFRFDDLQTVMRLRVGADWDAARAWFLTVQGQGYDWWGLLAFTSAKLQGRENGKQFCSEFAARYLRRAIGARVHHPAAREGNGETLAVLGLDPFNGYDADGIAPSEFRKSALLRVEMDA